MTQGHSVNVKSTGCWFDPYSFHSFSFLRSGVEAKRGIKFRYSMRNTFRMPSENREQIVIALGANSFAVGLQVLLKVYFFLICEYL